MPLLSALRRRKTLGMFAVEALRDAEHSKDSPQLTLFDLLCIGIGGTVGSGVFVLTGQVLPVAGPASCVCWIIGGAVCFLSAFSYMEMSTVVPTRGSTYAYASYALGEFAAVAGAVSLTLEYGLSGAGVARSWSSTMQGLIGGNWYSTAYGASDYYLDYLALIIQVVCVLVVAAGASLSTRVINVFTVSKVALVIFMIIIGFWAGSEHNFSSTPFMEKGGTGITSGTSLLFFGFIGFDEVVCMAARAENPKKIMPRAIAGTLGGAAVLSFLAQLSLSWVYRLGADDDGDYTDASFQEGFHRQGLVWAQWITVIGEVILLPLVVLLSFLPQPEVMAALGEDGLLPSAFAKRMRFNGADIFGVGTFWTGATLSVIALVVPFSVLWNMINLGVLFGFNITNASLISTRVGNGGELRDPAADRSLVCLACLWLPGAAYILWLGVALPKISGHQSPHGKRDSAVCLAFGIALLVQSFKSLIFLKRRCAPPDIADADRFRAPLVPFLPGVAIFINFVFMAQYSGIDHAYFFGLYGAAFIAYFLNKDDRARTLPDLTLAEAGVPGKKTACVHPAACDCLNCAKGAAISDALAKAVAVAKVVE
ncbi:amino acid permease-domain-containing protein [Pelagophyceae sp. CCMP2097]|nr:amino acid permease-domain-containing protein [Pelagophyceae sp. CCMP2097]